MTYERLTAATIADALRLAEEILTDRLPIEVTERDSHSIHLAGGDGTTRISVHSHGIENVVHVMTDQLRTSRLDVEVQYYLTLLPYQPNDSKARGTAQPGGLSRSPA
jgi:hypothetical protein